MRPACWTLVLLCAGALPAADETAAVRRVRERFAAAKPDAQRLAFYSLDWAMTLADAKERARREGRPVLLVLNTNITAGTNFFSGHT